MKDFPLTVKDLKKRRLLSLIKSERAVKKYPEIYKQIKRTALYILTHTVDIGEYYPIACEMADMLESLTGEGKECFFNYFFQNVDPRQKGNVRYFRADCLDMLEQFEIFEKWRLSRRNLTIISGGK